MLGKSGVDTGMVNGVKGASIIGEKNKIGVVRFPRTIKDVVQGVNMIGHGPADDKTLLGMV